MDKSFLKYAPTCMYHLWSLNVLPEKFILEFADKKIELDKDSGLREKKCEKKFVEAIESFIEWLKKAEEDESEDEAADEKEEDEESKEAMANLEAAKQASLEEKKLKQK